MAKDRVVMVLIHPPQRANMCMPKGKIKFKKEI